MGRAKEIRVAVIPARDAVAFVKKHHYSGTVTIGSRLHFGAFLDGRLHGVMSFGCPLDKKRVMSLVQPCGWNQMLELNRMAFDEYLPKNSESRCLGIAIRMIKKNAPHIKWILSFADGTQCGDGCIYRASGFVLTQIRANDQIIEFPDGRRVMRVVLTNKTTPKREQLARMYGIKMTGEALKPFFKFGARALPGYQLRYILLIDKTSKIMVPIIPFTKIDDLDARMYRGRKTAAIAQLAEHGGTTTGMAFETTSPLKDEVSREL